ncbi:hypothetical protein CEP52_013929 [Fusarium oligoseptatum]|uniref:Uncharacterized protein n=1 Tax=Fusarium oligoseptatum TaxID=2604345 RepID=A0A428SRA6_9HYPO|nr:hypothetical protein CEP52_013929 [Fusarium oligoseptatum]
MAHPLESLPLHVISQILEHLGTIQQLGMTVLSHRVFYTALKDNLHSVVGGILTRQIPEHVLPFAVTLRESERIKPGDHKAIAQFLSRFEAAVLDPAATLASLNKLSLSDYADLSRTYAAVESLRRGISKDAIHLVNKFGLLQSPILSQSESFRLDRAFFRYQIMCNLFCPPDASSPQDELEDLAEKYFSMFSPWVNEQLVCVYAYLERKVREAFDQLAAHDVDWGEMPIGWHEDANDSPRIQWFLSQGLCFLASVARAGTHEERANLLQLDNFNPRESALYPYWQLYSMVPDAGTLEPLGLEDTESILGLYKPEQLQKLSRQLDGPWDELGTGPYLTWLGTHYTKSIFNSTFCQEDWNLWDCVYVLWDIHDRQESQMNEFWERVRQEPSMFPPYRNTWLEEEIQQSERERTDIYFAGGSGYWPRNAIDFSRIKGLSDEQKGKLITKWKEEKHT